MCAGETFDCRDERRDYGEPRTTTVGLLQGRIVIGARTPRLNLRSDTDAVEQFKAAGPNWQTRINEALRNCGSRPSGREPLTL